MHYTCPVCGYPGLDVPPRDYEICPSCGTEFEYHNARRSNEELRLEWLGNGMPWYSHAVAQPVGWSPVQQLINAGYLRIRIEPAILGTSTRQEYRYPQNPENVMLRYQPV